MKIKQLAEGTERTFAVVLDPHEEVVGRLLKFARDHRVHAGRFTGLGAFSGAVLGYFEFDSKDYLRIPVEEQVEALSLVGDFATMDDEVKLHAHAVVGKRDGTAHGGHLLEARVCPTLEVIVTDSPSHLRRETDTATGLPLIRL